MYSHATKLFEFLGDMWWTAHLADGRGCSHSNPLLNIYMASDKNENSRL